MLLFLLYLLLQVCMNLPTNFNCTGYNEFIYQSETHYYQLNIPEKFRNNPSEMNTLPVIVGLHGGSGWADQFRRSSGLDVAAESANWASLFVEGYCFTLHRTCIWNAGAANPVNDIDHVAIIDQLFTEIMDVEIMPNVKLDSSMIFMVGHSNGGGMTYLYSTNSTQFQLKAIAPVSTAMGGVSSDQSGNIPYYPPVPPYFKTSLLHVHGLLDTNVPIDGGETSGGAPSEAGRTSVSMNWCVNYWLKSDTCAPDHLTTGFTVTRSDMGGRFTLKQYSTCPESRKVKTLTVTNAGHSWNEMSAELREADPKTDFCVGSVNLAQLLINNLVELIQDDTGIIEFDTATLGDETSSVDTVVTEDTEIVNSSSGICCVWLFVVIFLCVIY